MLLPFPCAADRAATKRGGVPFNQTLSSAAQTNLWHPDEAAEDDDDEKWHPGPGENGLSVPEWEVELRNWKNSGFINGGLAYSATVSTILGFSDVPEYW
ncbi:hypothetical protein ACS0TY_001472 [Phlomoides rotata]